MNQRITGFDLARAYAILGMFIVNFNFSFGSIMFAPTDSVGWFMSLFTGNSTAIFIICAGMGVSLMSNKPNLTKEEQSKLKSKVLKRSWFLFGLGLLLYNWWQGDILHFYGGYMHIAAFILFIPSRFYLSIAIVTLVAHNILLNFIPIETGWNFNTFDYTDFWSIKGFLRNSLYNGWNSIFPWFTYFVIGMWLGKLDWNLKKIKQNIFLTGVALFGSIQLLRYFAKNDNFPPFLKDYILAEYFPPYLPFILVTIGFALIVIVICIYIGEIFAHNKIIQSLQKTGQMTLTHYVIHLTIGVLIFQFIFNKRFTKGNIPTGKPVGTIYILAYAIAFFVISVIFSVIWDKKFKNGPLETLMRKVSN
ncbi:MAG: DUF418 domain-containing protein [Limnohabitans sp.]|nr:DUF418 domain-containing protein [Limnohabitans sp.]